MTEEKKERQKKPRDRMGEYGKMMATYLGGSSGPAGPCKRIDPRTGEVIGIVERTEK